MSSPPKDPNITPALKPPPGVKSNLVNPSSHGYVTVIVFVVFLGVSTPLLCLRMYVRRYINRRVWWDDCTLSFFLPFSLLQCISHESWRYGEGLLLVFEKQIGREKRDRETVRG